MALCPLSDTKKKTMKIQTRSTAKITASVLCDKKGKLLTDFLHRGEIKNVDAQH
jgi:folate-binding Fe-S cluster repair protein YgfZ